MGFAPGDRHLAPVACGVVGVVDRQAVSLALLGQPPQPVIDIAGDLPGAICLRLLTARRIIGIGFPCTVDILHIGRGRFHAILSW